MSQLLPEVETVTRDEAIKRLRTVLLSLTNEERCACKAVADKNVFCKGFRQWGDKELRERYWWIVRKRPDITREELEGIANDWQLAQQDVRDLPLACDVQTTVQDTCRGWNDFTNDELAVYFRQLTGKEIRVT